MFRKIEQLLQEKGITPNIYAHVQAERQQDTAEKVQAIFDMPSP